MRCLSRGICPSTSFATTIVGNYSADVMGLLRELHLGHVEGVVVLLINVLDDHIVGPIALYRVADQLAVEAVARSVAFDPDRRAWSQDGSGDRRAWGRVKYQGMLVLGRLVHKQA